MKETCSDVRKIRCCFIREKGSLKMYRYKNSKNVKVLLHSMILQLHSMILPVKLLQTLSVHLFQKQLDSLLVKDQLSPTCTLLASACKFSGHFLQTTIINGDKADSKILHLYLG